MPTTPPLAQAVTRGLLRQAEAFGVLGAWLHHTVPRLPVGPDMMKRFLDPDVLREMDTAKFLEMTGTTVANVLTEPRLDVTDLDRFILGRFRPCEPLFAWVGANGDSPPDPDLPLLYNTVDWPEGLPPAGRLGDAPRLDWGGLLNSYVRMWRLQLDRPKGADVAAMQAGNKMIRAALWIVRTQGFLPAVGYLFALMDRGLVIDRDAALWAFLRLFWTRRLVLEDADLPGYLLDDARRDMAGWRSAEFRPTPPALPVRALSDDVDLAIERVQERELIARAAADYDSWLLAYARLGQAARVTASVMRIAGLSRQLGYEAYVAQFEEHSADVGAFFGSLLRDGATDRPGSALRGDWGIARSFALIAERDGEDWLRHMLGERVVLPDALVPAFLEGGTAFAEKEGWRRPSPALSRVLAPLVYRATPIERQAAVNGDPTTTGLVETALREQREPGLAELAERASTLWPVFHREAVSGPPPHDGDMEILTTFLLYLTVLMPADRAEAAAWLDEQHLEWCAADLARSFEEPVEPGSRGDHAERLLRTERYAARYPFNGSVRAALALRQYEAGATAEARRTIEAALLLDPGLEHVWAAASLICHAAGEVEDDRAASAMTRFFAMRARD